MTYAQHTKVPESQTRSEIERLLMKAGATNFGFLIDDNRAVVLFTAVDRRIRFNLPLPNGKTDREAKSRRQKWRALLLCIKAKMESVESRIETFEEAFLAHVVVADGATVYEHVKQNLALTYKGGHVPALLPPPRTKD